MSECFLNIWKLQVAEFRYLKEWSLLENPMKIALVIMTSVGFKVASQGHVSPLPKGGDQSRDLRNLHVDMHVAPKTAWEEYIQAERSGNFVSLNMRNFV